MQIKRYWTYGSIVATLLLVFFSDLLTPRGVAVWLGYVVPLFLLTATPLRRYIYALVLFCSILLLLAALLSPPGISLHYSILNRTLFSLLLFFSAHQLMRRARAEEARRLVEEKFAKAFASSPAAIGITRLRDGEILEVNSTCLDMFGYSRDEVIGSSTLSLQTWPTPQDRERRTRELLEKGYVRQCEQMLRKKSGELFVALASAEILTMSGEKVILSTWIDITERRRAEEALRQSEEQLRVAAQAADIGMWRWTPGTEDVAVTANWRRLFGVSDDQPVTFATWRDSLHIDDREAAVKELNAAARERREFSVEYRVIRPDGTMRWVVDRGRASYDENGQAVDMAGVNVDITERKRAEEDLRKANQDLIRSNKDLEHFAYVASHDLQEPLRMVAGHLGMLAKRYHGRLDQDADEFIHFATDGAKRMSDMIQGLLEFSRVGREAKPAVPVDSGRALEQALKALDSRIRETGAAISYDALPTVLAEEVQLGQVFQNLIGNALKFRREGVQPQICFGAEKRDRKCLFSLADNGIGIDPKDQGRVFDLFERLHAVGTYPGSGMGLAICRRIIEQWGGEIHLESEPGEGTTFFFTLPEAPDR